MYDPNDMRSIIDIINNEELTEAPISQKIKNGITRAKAAIGSNKAKGEVDSIELANKLDTAFKQYLGRTGKEGTIRDVANFLISPSVGYDRDSVLKILNPYLKPMVNGSQNQNTDNSDNSQTEEPKVETPAPTEDKPEEPVSAETSNNDNSDENNEEPSDVDDIIEENINQILTYTNSKYSKNMSTDTASKIRKAVYSIVHNISDATPNMIKKGGNAALNAMAVLDYSGNIDTGQNGRIQDYLNKILSMDLNSGNVPTFADDLKEPDNNVDDDIDIDDEKEDDNKDQTSDSSTANDNTAGAKPKIRVPAGSKPTAKPTIRVPANSRPLGEAAGLSSSDIYDIFKQAAQYAYTNDMVGKDTYSDVPDNSYYSNSYRQPNYGNASSPSSNGIGSDKEIIKFEDKAIELAAGLGVGSWEFREARAKARQNQFSSLSPDDLNDFAAIGYCFLKAMRK